MTTKPKARKFRIRRNTPQSGQTAQPAEPQDVEEPPVRPRRPQPATAPNPTPPPVPREGQVSSAGEMDTAQVIDEIRREGLTGRQLRMARRVAQKHGMAPTSDFDAVRLLRAKGIDPFQRGTILELVTSDKSAGQLGPQANREVDAPKIQLPQTMALSGQNLPSTELSPAERRNEEITRIQKDIGRRRRRKLMLLMSRLSAFVFLPTLLAGYYYYAVATPMYTTKSAFLILTADGGSGPGASLFSGTPFATGQDAIATQDYLQSKDAMLRLDQDVGFRSHFSQDWIDPVQRLAPDASIEKAHKLYKKYVKLGYDPTEGVMRMELSTAEPEVSKVFSEKLIEYAEERVDQLSRKKRQDAVKIAAESLEKAKTARRTAQERLVSLQENSILDPTGEVATIRQLISSTELRLQEKQLALAAQQANTRPNRAKVAALESEIGLLHIDLGKQNARLNQAADGQSSLASQTAELQMAQADLTTADLVMQSSLETMRQSEIEATKQVRYLTVSVHPVASEDPSFPRSFENTVLAFLVFSGIYLLISLTASILREQVTS